MPSMPRQVPSWPFNLYEVQYRTYDCWPRQRLSDSDLVIGEQKMSMCGQKSGVDRAERERERDDAVCFNTVGTSWKEAWGKDDVYGRWGMREETEVDGYCFLPLAAPCYACYEIPSY
eukprot:1181258-Rhodomonas_salina.2